MIPCDIPGDVQVGSDKPRGPVLLPKILLPDGTPMGDSTFLIEHFEKELPQVYKRIPNILFVTVLYNAFFALLTAETTSLPRTRWPGLLEPFM